MSHISTTLPTRVYNVFWAHFSDTAVQGALWKVASCLSFSAINGIVHYFAAMSTPETPRIPAAELAFFETLFGFILILPWIYTSGVSLKTTEYKNYIFRA